ncbi:Cell division control protein 4 [Zancudomyces culisetae]|uniref:Cell division control protein 4 n=1 Tax=Zancudomyces culisetae TaxID=1213189 RepID=A0A1R1PXB1_ZANCU|nr:Cell division control protein 4 [Zancudomyces culisetae]|eukprot:OMH85547.1 Cell division control protein 4 [Zancudomyces culisetae]
MLEQQWQNGCATKQVFPTRDNDVVTCIQFDRNRVVAGFENTRILVYDINDAGVVNELVGHEGGVWALGLVGNTVVSGSTDRTVRVWNVTTGRCTHVFHGHSSTVRCLQIMLPVDVRTAAQRRAGVTAIYEPEFPLIVTGSRDSTLRVWKLPEPDTENSMQSEPYSDEGYEEGDAYLMYVWVGHSQSVRAVTSVGALAISGSYDNTIRVWDTVTGECLRTLVGHVDKVYSLAVDEERRIIFSGSMDGDIRQWSLDTGACLRTLEGHITLVGLLSFRNNVLVSGGADSTLRVWDTETGQQMCVLEGHTGPITCFQHDGIKVVSGGDSTIKLWNLKTGKFVRNISAGLGNIWQVDFDGKRLVTAVRANDVTFVEVFNYGGNVADDCSCDNLLL